MGTVPVKGSVKRGLHGVILGYVGCGQKPEQLQTLENQIDANGAEDGR